MRDPALTEYGVEQCRHLHSTFPYMESVDLVVASPLKRTIDTAMHSFKSAIEKRKLVVIALPELQETSDLPCDTGSSYEELAKAFAGKPVNLDLVKARPDWTSKKGEWAPWADSLHARAQKARQWLKQRKEKHIVVVTHGGFLHYFTEDFDEFQKFSGTGWAVSSSASCSTLPLETLMIHGLEYRVPVLSFQSSARPMGKLRGNPRKP